MGVATGRHIASRNVDRYEFLAELKARGDLHCKILNRRPLCVGKAAYLACGKRNIVLDPLRDVTRLSFDSACA